MRRFVRLLVFLVLAWVAGVLAYVISLYAIWGQTVGGDVTAILVWSALGLFVALPIIYLPLLLGLRYLRGGYQPVAAFSLLGALAGVVPTALIVYVWSGNLRGLFSPEAGLLYILFGFSGVVIGTVLAWPERGTKAAS